MSENEVSSNPVESVVAVVPESATSEPVAETITATPSYLTADANPVTEVEPEAPVEVVAETTTEPTTSEVKVEEIKTEDKPIEAKETESSQSDEPAPLPTYEEFKIPEGITLDTEQIGDFTTKLAEFESKTKADHAEVQAFGQSLIDRHVADVQKNIENYGKSLLDSFEQQKTSWREAFEKDPEIGGNRKDTTINAALEFIKTHGGNEDQRKEIHQLMDQTGAGNHPAVLRLFANAMRAMSEGKPLPASRPVIAKSKLDKFYGSTT